MQTAEGSRGRGKVIWYPLVVSAMLLAMPLSVASPAPSSSGGLVVAIWQSGYITEQGNFTVSMELSNVTGIQFVYFAFCQLSSPVCYQPIVMTLHGTNLYVGTTDRMSSYDGMTEGVRAGYNITIEFADNSTLREPNLPNAFSNLTVAQEVGGENMFEMTVSPQLYGLSGIVTNSVTGAAIAGASVALSPGNQATATTTASGAYTFSGLLNGTYSLSVSYPGFTNDTQSIAISGQDLVKDLSLSNSSSGSKTTGGGGSSSLPGGTTLWLVLALVVIVIAVVAGLLVVRRRKPTAPPPSSPDRPT